MKKLDKFFVNPDIKKADTLPSSFYKNDQQYYMDLHSFP